ncbi:MAG: hypothetical protein ABSG86_31275 [Thermoguttaceae bacterium]|jgi:hypothetical protein
MKREMPEEIKFPETTETEEEREANMVRLQALIAKIGETEAIARIFLRPEMISRADDAIRATVEEIDRDYDQAFVGSLGRKENMPIIYQWTGEWLSPFSIDFVVPRLDRVLIALLTQRINGTYPGPAWASLFLIEERIHKIRGYLLHWNGRPKYDPL